MKPVLSAKSSCLSLLSLKLSGGHPLRKADLSQISEGGRSFVCMADCTKNSSQSGILQMVKVPEGSMHNNLCT